MTISTLIGFVAGALQFVVAAYALRLNRRFGTARVGWSLFCAFALLALLHLAQVSIIPSHSALSFGAEVEVTYALISVLLLTGMIHLEAMLKERIKMEQKEQQLRSELELEVKKKTEYLTRAIEGLQAEIDERKRMETAVENADFELRAVSSQMELAGMANSVLQNSGALLNSANIKVERIVQQIQQDENFTSERSTQILGELNELKTNLSKVTSMQQNYVRLANQSEVAGVTTTWDQGSPEQFEYSEFSSATPTPARALDMMEFKL